MHQCKGGENTTYGTLENIALATSTDGCYYTVYEISTDQASTGGYGSAQWSHMFARSRDLINWEITEGPLLTQENSGFGYDGPCRMVVDNRLYVYMRVGNSTTAVELTLSE